MIRPVRTDANNTIDCPYCNKAIVLESGYFIGRDFVGLVFRYHTQIIFCPHCRNKLRVEVDSVNWKVKQ